MKPALSIIALSAVLAAPGLVGCERGPEYNPDAPLVEKIGEGDDQRIVLSDNAHRLFSEYDPAFLDQFDTRFITESFMGFAIFDRMLSDGITPDVANNADRRLSGSEIIELVKNGKDLDKKYGEHFKTVDNLYWNDIEPDFADPFEARFGFSIPSFKRDGYDHNDANPYNERFMGGEVLMFLNNGASDEVVNEYHEDVTAREILIYEQMKIDDPEISTADINQFVALVEKTGKHLTPDQYERARENDISYQEAERQIDSQIFIEIISN